MNLVEKIKSLCEEKEISLVGLERELGFSRGSIFKWNNSSPSIDKIKIVADYFNVSTDWLLNQTPFKNETEAYHSISVASIRYLQIHPNEIPDFYEAEASLERMYLDNTDQELIAYCENLILKFNKNLYLTDLELFELANILFAEIKWSPDLDGRIYFVDFCNDTFSITIDFEGINKITLNLSNSFLTNYKKSHDTNFIKYLSFLSNSKNENPKTFSNDNIYTIAAHHKGEDWSNEELEEIEKFKEFVRMKRKQK
ncbi:helix-turn-helix domain-containing protein [Anaerophilus nitritogenes]|uniref:helix-turn-helix domain-containing protein n=1 Tax=Anaerophilus nitritogenes TaxID=2498136 RepID=UPI001930F92D|nr:helix-turn-helix transcriptional regulator [Anaerophilus nitritogenes]